MTPGRGAQLGVAVAAVALAVGLVGAVSGSRAGPTMAGKRFAEAQRGPRGPRGPRGRRGPRGYRGLRGATGPQRVQGALGPTGQQGPQGPPGPQGLGLTRPGFTRTVVAGVPAGMHPAVAIGADRLPLLTYDRWHGLEVAHCDDLACTSATRTTLDPGSETTRPSRPGRTGSA